MLQKSLTTTVRQIGDVSQQDDSGTICLKFTLKQVVCDIACLKGFSHAPVRVRTPVGAGQIEFVHQTSDLFEIHDHRRIHMKQDHADAPR